MQTRQIYHPYCILGIIVLMIVVASCSQKMVKNYLASLKNEPIHINFSPDSTGLLIIDVTMKNGSLDLVRINKERGDNEMIEGKCYKNIGIFPGLEPGNYQFVFCKTSSGEGWMELPIPTSESTSIEVKVGIPTYCGQLKINWEDGGHVDAEWRQDSNIEIIAWRKILKKYPDSPWASLINERIKNLGEIK